MTQGMISITKNNKVLYKIVSGSNGYNIKDLEETIWKIINSKKELTEELLYELSIEKKFGEKESLVVISRDNLIYKGDEEIEKDSLYYTKFEKEDFNPRWSSGECEYYLNINLKDELVKKETKRIIIIRKDLRNTKGEKIRTGKYIAQAGHAIEGNMISMLIGANYGEEGSLKDVEKDIEINKKIKKDTPWHAYLSGIFKKICLAVHSEEELLKYHENILAAGYNSTLVIDKGLTEFGGVPTATCLTIEPLFEEDANKITGKLKPF